VGLSKLAQVSPSAEIAGANLRVDGATAEVLRAFSLVGVQSILLKGPSVVRWLYDAKDPRSYIDSDLLVRPADVATARHALAHLGFQPNLDERKMPAWWREHAVGWLRRQDGAIVDLHRTLPGIGVHPERVWLTLSANTETIVVGGFPATTLTIPGRAFHVATHAAQHGVGWENVLAELERALSRADAGTWGAAAQLAAELDATAAFATGLRMVPAGRTLASALDLPTAQPVDVALRASTPPPVALGFDQLTRADGWRERLGIMRHKLVPPASFMGAWSPVARQGRLGMARAYASRPFWLLRHAPAGFRAWREARRRARLSATARPRRAARWPRPR
jgi:hypothetical protein